MAASLIVDRKSLARVLGISTRHVQNLLADGALQPITQGLRGRSSKYDLAAVVPEYIRLIRKCETLPLTPPALARKTTSAKQRHARRAQVRGLISIAWAHLTNALLDFYEWQCAYCRVNLLGQARTNHPQKLTWDHVQPISKGGTDTVENIVPCCFRCNTLKGNRTAGWTPRKAHPFTSTEGAVAA